MTATVLVLGCLLKQQKKHAYQKGLFKHEMITLISLLVIFDLSIALRIAYDTWLIDDWDRKASNFTIVITIIVLPLIFDTGPMCCILMAHSWNFKTIKSAD